MSSQCVDNIIDRLKTSSYPATLPPKIKNITWGLLAHPLHQCFGPSHPSSSSTVKGLDRCSSGSTGRHPAVTSARAGGLPVVCQTSPRTTGRNIPEHPGTSLESFRMCFRFLFLNNHPTPQSAFGTSVALHVLCRPPKGAGSTCRQSVGWSRVGDRWSQVAQSTVPAQSNELRTPAEGEDEGGKQLVSLP